MSKCLLPSCWCFTYVLKYRLPMIRRMLPDSILRSYGVTMKDPFFDIWPEDPLFGTDLWLVGRMRPDRDFDQGHAAAQSSMKEELKMFFEENGVEIPAHFERYRG